VKVVVDFDRCQGNANCMDQAPAVFEVLVDGTLVVLAEEPADEERVNVEEAARLCPTGAIKVIG
jgi:ferredoxin